jgi:hypothetical protein
MKVVKLANNAIVIVEGSEYKCVSYETHMATYDHSETSIQILRVFRHHLSG